MFKVFWMDIDKNGENVAGSRQFPDADAFREFYRTKPSTVKIYRATNMMPMRDVIIRRQFAEAV